VNAGAIRCHHHRDPGSRTTFVGNHFGEPKGTAVRDLSLPKVPNAWDLGHTAAAAVPHCAAP